jgi:hypothetical protein
MGKSLVLLVPRQGSRQWCNPQLSSVLGAGAEIGIMLHIFTYPYILCCNACCQYMIAGSKLAGVFVYFVPFVPFVPSLVDFGTPRQIGEST